MPKVKELLMPSMSMNADNYPETLAALIIINAPMVRLASTVWYRMAQRGNGNRQHGTVCAV